MKERKTEHPILFGTLMVQAILALIKFMTRRTRGLEKINKDPNAWYLQTLFLHATGRFTFAPVNYNPQSISDVDIIEVKCPYGQKGDKLWVRESFKKMIDFPSQKEIFVYKETMVTFNRPAATEWKWKPSIHMPKVACRIWLEITNIRVERLHDITEDDAKSEGIEFLEREDPYTFGFKLYGNHSHSDILGRKALTGTALESFQSLWESINGPESWNANPWVWVIEFKKIDKQ